MDQVHVLPVYGINRLCKDFDISRTAVYAEIKAGRLKAFKLGDRTMVAGEDALAWRDTYRRGGFRKATYPSAA